MLGRLEKKYFSLLVLQALESLLQQGLSLEEALREVGRMEEGGSGGGEDRGRLEGALQRELREAMEAGGMTQEQVLKHMCCFRNLCQPFNLHRVGDYNVKSSPSSDTQKSSMN